MLSFPCLYPFQETGSALIAVVSPATEEVGGIFLSSPELELANLDSGGEGAGLWEKKANFFSKGLVHF